MTDREPDVCTESIVKRTYEDKLGIRAKKHGSVRSYACGNEQLHVGCKCVIESQRGKEIATVAWRTSSGLGPSSDPLLE